MNRYRSPPKRTNFQMELLSDGSRKQPYDILIFFIIAQKELKMNRLRLHSSICQTALDITNSSLVHDTVMMLTNIRPVPTYKDGEKTDKIGAYMYECVDLFSFDRISIKVEGSNPLIDPEDLLERREAGEKIFVEVIGGTVTAYYNERLNSIEDSFKARELRIVTNHEI